FIESPYRKVRNGRVLDYVTVVNAGDTDFKVSEHVEQEKVDDTNQELSPRRRAEYEPYCFYLTAYEEDRYVIAQAN
ncbi:hypothetical protein MYX77_14800, partial [Acidobacteriia bacterium AH_259_A11_L15]|nr:hypothetical protein [Acidobacteriia bacterium AH_259_A11_L15]